MSPNQAQRQSKLSKARRQRSYDPYASPARPARAFERERAEQDRVVAKIFETLRKSAEEVSSAQQQREHNLQVLSSTIDVAIYMTEMARLRTSWEELNETLLAAQQQQPRVVPKLDVPPYVQELFPDIDFVRAYDPVDA